MLPKKIKNNESVVINTEDFLDGNGSHWVCVVNKPDSKHAEYFDSFGVHPSDVVVDYMKTSRKEGVYNDSHIQHVDSIMCGYYVCYFILERDKGRSMLDILLDFSTPDINETMIERFALKTGAGIKWQDRLADELHKQVRKKFPRRRVEVNGIDRIWSADLVDMQRFSRDNHGVKYLLTVIDVFSKYAWIMPLKNKTGKSITEAFTEIVAGSKRKPDKLWVDKGTEFYNRTFRDWLKENEIDMYSTHNEGKAVVVERFNRTIKTWMWKYFTANSTRRYFDALPELLRRYNHSVHRSIKMSPHDASQKGNEAEVWSNLYGQSTAKRKPRFAVGDRVRITKAKRHFEKGYTANWTEEVFVIDKVLPTSPPTYAIVDLAGEPIEGSFYEQELQKTNQDQYRIEKIVRKDNKNKRALVKWLGYPSKFNSWMSFEDLE